MLMEAPAMVCRKAWWQEQRGGVWAVPAGSCACLGFGCPGTIACQIEARATEHLTPEPLARTETDR
jgi:hypothetical protein